MLNFCSLYSGSSGNSLFVETENTKLLIDAGVSSKKIENALDGLNINPSLLDGILITHEHSDHVKGLGTYAKKLNFAIGDTFEINDLKIKSFAIPHDAVNPCGFNISNNEKNISIATDIGHMTKEILKVLEPSDFVLLESNYDPEVLKCYLLKCNLKTAMLGHLSKESNFPELAYKTVLDEVIAGNCKEDSLNLSVASRDIPGKLIKI